MEKAKMLILVSYGYKPYKLSENVHGFRKYIKVNVGGKNYMSAQTFSLSEIVCMSTEILIYTLRAADNKLHDSINTIIIRKTEKLKDKSVLINFD